MSFGTEIMEDLVGIAGIIKNNLFKLDAKITSLNMQNQDLFKQNQNLAQQTKELTQAVFNLEKEKDEIVKKLEQEIQLLVLENERLDLIKSSLEEKNLELRVECTKALKQVERALSEISIIEDTKINQLTNTSEYNGDSRSTT
ncbi:MAG: hypothetical protein SFT68_01710 [Rickettsiaceae bacterium]|nr:hypothetical protein [Rickettsiaceae bacterium]